MKKTKIDRALLEMIRATVPQFPKGALGDLLISAIDRLGLSLEEEKEEEPNRTFWSLRTSTGDAILFVDWGPSDPVQAFNKGDSWYMQISFRPRFIPVAERNALYTLFERVFSGNFPPLRVVPPS